MEGGGAAAPPAVSDDELKSAVATIVATGDLQSMTKRSVLAELTNKYGDAVVAGRLEMLRATINEQIEKLSRSLAAAAAAAAAPAEQAEAPAAEEEKPAAKKRAKAAPKAKKEAAPKKKKAEDGAAVPAEGTAADDLPTNVELEVDLDSFRRRNPGRTGRAVEKPRKEKAAKKVRDPSKPKRPGKIMQLSGPMQDFFGAPQGTRTDVAAKVRAYIKEKDLQDPKVFGSFWARAIQMSPCQDKRNILLEKDPEMQKLWPRQKKTTYFKINQLLTKHLFNKGDVCAMEEDEDDEEDEEEQGEEDKGKEEEEDGKNGAEANNGAKDAPVAPAAAAAATGAKE